MRSKNIFGLLLSCTVALLFAVTVCGQKGASQAVYGKMTDHMYTNSVLGIRIDLPKELEIDAPQYPDVALVPTQVPGSMFAGQTLTIKNLFTSRLFPVQFIWTAAKLPASAANATGEQILNDRLFRTADGPKAKVEKLGKNSFAYVDGATRFNKNRSYAIVKKGYYISIVMMYKADGDLDALRGVLAGADFDWVGK